MAYQDGPIDQRPDWLGPTDEKVSPVAASYKDYYIGDAGPYHYDSNDTYNDGIAQASFRGDNYYLDRDASDPNEAPRLSQLNDGTVTFLGLDQTPSSFAGDALKHLRVNAAEDAIEFVSPTLLLQNDFPSSYSGDALKLVRVNAGETGLEFASAATALDAIYLRLDTTNDPLTNHLEIVYDGDRQLRLSYDGANYCSFQVPFSGNVWISPTGAETWFYDASSSEDVYIYDGTNPDIGLLTTGDSYIDTGNDFWVGATSGSKFGSGIAIGVSNATEPELGLIESGTAGASFRLDSGILLLGVQLGAGSAIDALQVDTDDGAHAIGGVAPYKHPYGGMLRVATVGGGEDQYHLSVEAYDTADIYGAVICCRLSNSNTLGTKTTTTTNQQIGGLGFTGVNTGGDWALGAFVKAIQADNAGAANVPTNLELSTFGASGENDNQFVLDHTGNALIGTGEVSGSLGAGDVVFEIQVDGEPELGLYRSTAGDDALISLSVREDQKAYFGVAEPNAPFSEDVFVIDCTSGDVDFRGAANVSIPDDLDHYGDTDTLLRFSTDRIQLLAGNVVLANFQETTQDIVEINQNAGDVDFAVHASGLSNALLVQGSDGNVGLGQAPDERLHLRTYTHGADCKIKFTAENAGGTAQSGWVTYDPDLNEIGFENGGVLGLSVNSSGGVTVYDRIWFSASTQTNIYAPTAGNDLYIDANDDIYLRPDDDIGVYVGGTNWAWFNGGQQSLVVGNTTNASSIGAGTHVIQCGDGADEPEIGVYGASSVGGAMFVESSDNTVHIACADSGTPVSYPDCIILDPQTNGEVEFGESHVRVTNGYLYANRLNLNAINFQIFESGGNLFFQTNDASAGLYFKTGSATQCMSFESGGNCRIANAYSATTGSAANVNVATGGLLRRSTSSRRYKRDIVDWAPRTPLKDVRALRPRLFHSLDQEPLDPRLLGFIAEEIHEVIPEATVRGEDGKIENYDQRCLIALLVEAVKRLTDRVEGLERAYAT